MHAFAYVYADGSFNSQEALLPKVTWFCSLKQFVEMLETRVNLGVPRNYNSAAESSTAHHSSLHPETQIESSTNYTNFHNNIDKSWVTYHSLFHSTTQIESSTNYVYQQLPQQRWREFSNPSWILNKITNVYNYTTLAI